jgi:hypothetical protein
MSAVVWVAFAVASTDALKIVKEALTSPSNIFLSPTETACWTAFHPNNPYSFRTDVAPEVRVTNEADALWKCARTALGWTILPPLALLALGFALSWAAQGFKEPQKDTHTEAQMK